MTHHDDTTDVAMYEVDGPAVQFVIDPSTDTAPGHPRTATVIGGAADFRAAARVLDRLDASERMLSDLVAFVAARLDEDRHAASRVALVHGIWATPKRHDGPFEETKYEQVVVYGPDRALAEVAAKRAILDGYTAALAHPNRLNDAAAHLTMTLLGRVVCQLAAVYRSHPDWREDWAA